jgi:hypothetical protein
VCSINSILFWLCTLLGVILSNVPVKAEVFYAKDEALERAFPDAETVLTHTFVLTEKDLNEVSKRAHSAIDSHLVTFFEGRKAGKSLGFAAIGSEVVRTLPQTFMVVLSPDGTVQSTYILAFHEPLDYLPPERWLDQFEGKRLSNDLKLSGEISGILGSTLSVRAVTKGVRRVLALYELLLADQPAS